MLTFLSQLSVAVARPLFAGSSEVPHSTIALVGQVRIGGMVSCTVMVWVHWAKLPQASVTRYTRVTFPGQLPTSPLSLTRENVGAASQASLATPPAALNEARSAYAGGTSSAHWTAIFGQVMAGAIV